MKLHHLELQCKSLIDQLETFCNKLNFVLCAVKCDDCDVGPIKAVVIRHGTFHLVLQEKKGISSEYISDVAIETKDLQTICDNVIKNNGDVIQKPELTQDRNFRTAVVKSPIGKVRHTLLDNLNNQSEYLPSYVPIEVFLTRINGKMKNNGCAHSKKIEALLQELFDKSRNNELKTESTFLDHVAFAVESGSAFRYIEWYDKVFGFKRFKMNKVETPDGFIVSETSKNSSMLIRLLSTAMSYHMCSEVGCEADTDAEDNSLKFVFGESFPNHGPNQIHTFIKEHGGEGLQHIALNTKDIVKSTLEWKANNVEFVIPPVYYYDEIDNNFTGKKFFEKDVIEKLGILIDVEECEDMKEEGYLLQIFTKPLFSKKTIFLELIERHSSFGFGASNIIALFRAFGKYYEEQGLM